MIRGEEKTVWTLARIAGPGPARALPAVRGQISTIRPSGSIADRAINSTAAISA